MRLRALLVLRSTSSVLSPKYAVCAVNTLLPRFMPQVALRGPASCDDRRGGGLTNHCMLSSTARARMC